jgi:manganese efflux pump family protein
MLAVLVVAVALGLSNFAGAIAIGLAGVDARTRLRVGVTFGAFEAGMPVVGLLIGAQAAAALGHASRWLAAALLIAVGGYALAASTRAARRGPGRGPESAAPQTPVTRTQGRPGSGGLGRLIVAGLALSADNLAVGFALGSYHTSVLVGAITIGAVSVALALAGLELGARIGARAGERGGQLAGLMLIAVGVAIAAGGLS